MKHRAAALVLILTLAACAEPGGRQHLKPVANPSAVVATEFAFAREAREKGQWTAFRDYAADDAVMFEPQPVNARNWLRKQANPAQAMTWQPYAVWSSCDGSLAVSKGAWQRPDGTNGYFTTVWRRQPKGGYKWELDQGDTLAKPLPAPEMISGQVADCSKPAAPAVPPVPTGVDRRVGWSDDRTLEWTIEVKPDGPRRFEVRRWTGSGYEQALRSDVAGKGSLP